MPSIASALGSQRRLLHKLTKLPEHAPLIARLGFARYKIFMKVLPVVVVAIAVRAILEATVPSFDGLIQSSTVTPFAASSMFVIALMLAGVMEDYKEAERIPANITNVFDSLSEKIEYCGMITRRKKAQQDAKEASGHHNNAEHGGHGHKEEEEEIVLIDSTEMHGELLNFLTYFLEFLANMRTEQEIVAIITTYCKWISAKIDEAAEITHIEVWEITDLFNDLRENISRLAVIKRTNFIPSGYSLMQVLVYATVILTSLAKYDDGGPDVPAGGGGVSSRNGDIGDDGSSSDWFSSNLAVYCNVATYSFLFVYVLSLIDDLEDPFEYSIYSLLPNLEGENKQVSMHSSGSADVDVFPLLELYTRLASLAGRNDIVGSKGGIRAYYNLAPSNPLEELRKPSELVEEADRNEMDNNTTNTRDHYRELLQDSMYTVLRNIQKQNNRAIKSSGSSRRLTNRNTGSVNGGNDDSSFTPLIEE